MEISGKKCQAMAAADVDATYDANTTPADNDANDIDVLLLSLAATLWPLILHFNPSSRPARNLWLQKMLG